MSSLDYPSKRSDSPKPTARRGATVPLRPIVATAKVEFPNDSSTGWLLEVAASCTFSATNVAARRSIGAGGGTTLVMKLPKILCASALGIAGFLGLLFLVDMIAGIPFGRFSIPTDIVVILACGLIIWQGLETWFEL